MMPMRRRMGYPGVLLIAIASMIALPGCGAGGGAAQETEPSGEVKIVAPSNPSPDYVAGDNGASPAPPAGKAK